MPRIVSIYSGRTVRIGDKFDLPGRAEAQIVGFDQLNVHLKKPDGGLQISPLEVFGLQWTDKEVEPSTLMTEDDWIHASNTAREVGGHFMGFLARAFQHADGENRPPLKKAYHTHFFRYLDEERRAELRKQAAGF